MSTAETLKEIYIKRNIADAISTITWQELVSELSSQEQRAALLEAVQGRKRSVIASVIMDAAMRAIKTKVAAEADDLLSQNSLSLNDITKFL